MAMVYKTLTGWNSQEIVEYSDETDSFSDVDFGFLYELDSSGSSNNSSNYYIEEDEEEDESSYNVEENQKFWETQNQLLQAILFRTSSFETRIRQTTKEAIKELNRIGVQCTCRKPVTNCRNCLRREILVWLQGEGYNSAICKSKWKSSHDKLPGEHTYLEVVEKSSPKKGEVRVVIELNFRAEFEMARASDEYNQLINRLPEVFVGKAERLNGLIKILCAAAKMCMKEKKMHLGPWRKHKYMQSKWLGMCERSRITFEPSPAAGFSNRQAKPKASLLTCDLLENLSVMRCTAVKVL